MLYYVRDRMAGFIFIRNPFVEYTQDSNNDRP